MINVMVLKNVEDWQISSQAMQGKGSMEGSTTRQMSPNNNSAHECAAPISSIIGDDIVCSAWKHAEGWIKSQPITPSMEQIEGMSVVNSRALTRGQRV